MKTITRLAIAVIAIMAVVSCGDAKKKGSKDAEKNTTASSENVGCTEAELENVESTEAELENYQVEDKISYLLGVNLGLMLDGNGFFDGVSEVNMKDLKKGLADAFKNGQPSNPYAEDAEWAALFQVSPYEMNQIFGEHLQQRREQVMEKNLKEGEAFLAENQKKEGVQVTESGLQYIIHAEGEGAKVKPEDKVLVNYRGTLIDGTEFDANDSTEFFANQVIKGWTEGLGLLGKSGKATLFIPSELAYGERGAGSKIGPNSTLIFEVEVLDIIEAE